LKLPKCFISTHRYGSGLLGHLGSCRFISSAALLSSIQKKICGRGQTGNITPAFHVSHSLSGCMSLQVKVAVDGQGEYEVEVGKHFYFTVADHFRGK